ncbi:MAG TPA: hypothetical protein VHP83_17745 [Aggregatilineaceae bacterium]|nr:hypothetical protein [Aggregatilineaceae bacterium]
MIVKTINYVYHLDLHGDIRQNPKLSGTTHNVFGIQVGVGITIAIKASKHEKHKLLYNRVPEYWRKEEKLTWLTQNSPVLVSIPWRELVPDTRYTWMVPEYSSEFDSFLKLGSKETKIARMSNVGALFKSYSRGVYTGRDDVVYSFDNQVLATRIETITGTGRNCLLCD